MVFAIPMNITTGFLPSCAFQKTVTKIVWVVRARHRLSRPSSIVLGNVSGALSGTGHSVAMAGAVDWQCKNVKVRKECLNQTGGS